MSALPYVTTVSKVKPELKKAVIDNRKYKRQTNGDFRRFAFAGYSVPGFKLEDLPWNLRSLAETLAVNERAMILSANPFRKKSWLKRVK